MKKLSYEEILEQRISYESVSEITRNPIYVVLENVRSLYNVGSFFRTCDSIMAKELILTGFTPTPPRTEIYKTALGAVDTVPWRYFKDTTSAIEYLKSLNVKVFVVEITDKKRKYDSLTSNEFPAAFIFGNELTGIENSTIELSDDAIEIPMYGTKHSLNVAVSAGIILYEALKSSKN